MLQQNQKTRLNKLYHGSVTRAKKKGLTHTLTKDYIHTLWIGSGGYCPVTGIKLELTPGTIKERNPNGASIDRFDNTKGYVNGNVRIVSTWYNNMKGSWDEEFVQDMAKRMIERLG